MTTRALAWVAPMTSEAAALGRTILFAHLIGPEELGRSILLGLSLRLVEMVSDVGVERLLAQAPDGDEPKLQAQLQGALILRGAAMATVLSLLAYPMALAFPDGPDPLTYVVLAVTPLTRGFLHLDYRRAERVFDYRGLAIVEIIGAAGLLLGALAGALILREHEALIVAVTAQSFAQVVISHIVAQRSYRVAFKIKGFTRLVRFGGPLVLNAILMFATMQIDRAIVAYSYGWAQLAIYGVTFQLAYLPAQIVGRAGSSLMAPRFRLALAEGRLDVEARRSLAPHVAIALLFSLGFAVGAPPAIGLVFGGDMTPSLALAATMGLAAGLRIARTPFSQLAVSMGRTGDTARANLWRAAALGPTLAAAALGAPLYALAAAAAMGELLAAVAGWRLYAGADCAITYKGANT
ncbi:MAG: oligosaccharide flippase family protein [Paracoccaceae bacterium]|nr:oligosaccharide flippase family protein [Paracoccaceae bacterium]MDG1369896.1 oligosaccharide flippase family protein [Paracoccaceae bacterium]